MPSTSETLPAIQVWFRDRTLRVRFHVSERDNEIHVLKAGPLPQAWYKPAHGPWRWTVSRTWSYGGMFSQRDFDALVPPAIAAVLRTLPNHHHAFWLAASHTPALLDLAVHDKVLAWWLSNVRMFRPTVRTCQMRRALGRGRAEVLTLLGGDGKRVLHLARKVRIETLQHVAELQPLLGLGQARLGQLAHTPWIDGDMLGVAGTPEFNPMVGPRLLAAMACMRSPRSASEVSSVTSQLWAVLSWTLVGGEPAPVFRDPQHLAGWWQAARHRLAVVRGAETRWQPAAALPMASLLPGLTRLHSDLDLVAEGARMHHCIGRDNGPYLAMLRQGRAAALHLEGPPAATVYLVHDGERWLVREMRGRANATTPAWQRSAVERWLRSIDGWPSAAA